MAAITGRMEGWPSAKFEKLEEQVDTLKEATQSNTKAIGGVQRQVQEAGKLIEDGLERQNKEMEQIKIMLEAVAHSMAMKGAEGGTQTGETSRGREGPNRV